MTRLTLALVLSALLLAAPAPARAQPNCGNPPNMLIIQDRSGSMSSYNKWNDAKNAINTLVSKYSGQIYFSLMLFPGPGGSCNAGQINVPIGANTASQIKSTLSSTGPTGATPLYYSLVNAHGYLKGMSNQKQKYAILVSDGMPNCASNGSQNSITEVNNMRAAGIKTYVVGFGSGVDANLLNNLAMAGGTPQSGGTKYFQANNASQLSAALQSIGSMVSCCGNGILDAGEKCEKTIPAGKPGACPRAADCNDNKPCTNDYVTGSECNVVCAHSPVTAAKSGDGCCPPGANSNNDSDCSAACGNGVLEQGEGCDPGIKSGAGKCKTAADCDDKDVCTADKLVGSACQVSCQNTAIEPDSGRKDGCCPAGHSSITDADCLPPCGPDTSKNCVDVCKDVKCPDGFYCYAGKCIAKSKQPGQDGSTPGQDPDGGPADPNKQDPQNPSDPNNPTDPNLDGFIGGEGCACRAAGPAAPGATLPLGLLLLLGLSLARRRR